MEEKYFGTNCSFNFADLVEDGVKLNLTVIETPGFGDQLNRDEKYED